MSAVAPRRTFEFNLEALRGIAALIVVVHHALLHRFSLDPAYGPDNARVNPLPGHSSVLLFFILSGYVIGLTNTIPLTLKDVLPYLRKRFVRLYPIYAISLLFALAVATRHYAPATIVAHFVFLQNATVSVIWENNPLWSLNNEVVYYLIFIPLSLLRFRAGWVCLASLLLGLLSSNVLQMPLLSSYCLGFVFWTSGLWLAQSHRFHRQFSSPWLLFGLVLVFMGFEFLNPTITPVMVLIAKLPIHSSTPSVSIVSVTDLVRWPFCFYLFLRFTNHSFRGSGLFTVAVIALSYWYYCHIGVKFGWDSPQSIFLLPPVIFLSLGAVLLAVAYSRQPPQQSILLPGALLKLGAISYGVYAIHFPISILLSHFRGFSGSVATFSSRLVLDVTIVLVAGYLLEMKVQPWFKQRLSK